MNDRSPRGSEATREMRDTARRRRDAEEKLQQHLLEARDHVPNEHPEARAAGPDESTPGASDPGASGHGSPGRSPAGQSTPDDGVTDEGATGGNDTV